MAALCKAPPCTLILQGLCMKAICMENSIAFCLVDPTICMAHCMEASCLKALCMEAICMSNSYLQGYPLQLQSVAPLQGSTGRQRTLCMATARRIRRQACHRRLAPLAVAASATATPCMAALRPLQNMVCPSAMLHVTKTFSVMHLSLMTPLA